MLPMAAGKRTYGHMLDLGGDVLFASNKRHQPSQLPQFRRNSSIGNGNSLSQPQQQQQNQLQQQTSPDCLFRILCPAAKIGSVIGKGGNIIKLLRHQTGTRIKIDDPVPGSDERVIVIGSYTSDNYEDDGGTGVGVIGGSAALLLEKDERILDDYRQGKEVLCPAQLALFKVHCRILAADKYDEEAEDFNDLGEEDYGEKVVTRMLVPDNQVGCLLGKRGRIIEQMREETGSQIRILPRELLPPCALTTDEVVQVAGDRAGVKRALNAISTRLLDNPPKDRPNSAPFGSRAGPSSAFSNSDAFLQQHTALVQNPRQQQQPRSSDASLIEAGYQLLRPTAPSLSEFGGGRHMTPMDEELVFRVLCPNDKILTIMGKGGSVLQTLREETGAKIKVADAIPGCSERVIIVSAVETPDDDLSPAQEAVFHLQDKMREGDTEGVMTRLLVPSNQVGCLLGKGGNIITEMRKTTRANIRVLSKESLPICALENDEVVQIIGEIRLARDALVRITSRLRANLYREKAVDTGRSDDFSYQRSVSPGGYSSVSSFGLQGSQTAAPRSPHSWLIQQNDRGMNYGGVFGLGTGPSLASNLGSTVVTSTRLELFIPEAAVLAVLGQNGSNLAHISKISGAKMVLNDGFPGGSADRVIEISGTPEQTNKAKSLVEAFVVSRG